jgi:hypothetical protein
VDAVVKCLVSCCHNTQVVDIRTYMGRSPVSAVRADIYRSMGYFISRGLFYDLFQFSSSSTRSNMPAMEMCVSGMRAGVRCIGTDMDHCYIHMSRAYVIGAKTRPRLGK